MPIPSGTLLGPYEILAPLGAGGMGEVHRARDTRLGREVAIKVLPARLSADPDAQARFEREARLVSSLQHPNICTLFDVGGEAGSRYLVMELIDGESLADRLARGRLPVPEVLRLGAQIADALERAHRAGVVHRDLKPANVMVTKSGAKLVDFGLARLTLPETGGLLAEDGRTLTIGTERGAILGTVGYLAPEQVRGAPADARSDLFALGALLYEAASGRRAFHGDTPVATLYAVLNDEPPPLAGVAPDVPPALERAVHVCLAKDPDERWQSALDLARELRWIAGAPRAGSAPAAGPPRGAALRWAAGLVAAFALGAAGALLGGRGARPGVRVVSSIDPPPGARLVPGHGPMALSADGRQLAFVAADS
jgi:eukaryotic-like serine/threonine-protein kinase